MNKRIVSEYQYPIKHALKDGSVLRLNPGVTIVDEKLWERAKRERFRLRAQIATGRISDGGFLVDWLVTHHASAEAAEVNALTQQGAKQLAKRLRKNKEALSALLEKAERGGIKDILRAALAAGG